jgi:hypothetical protein
MAIARLAAVSLDAPEPDALATFYAALLDLERSIDGEDFIVLEGAGTLVAFHRVPDHKPATWPTNDVPKQLHLELVVDDLDPAVAAARGLGASLADVQPSPDSWRVMLDPAGHPFCLVLARGALSDA